MNNNTRESLISRMLELNTQYSNASSQDEKNHIMMELAALVPDELKTFNSLDANITKIHDEIKQTILFADNDALQTSLTKLQALQSQIRLRAKQLNETLQSSELHQLEELIRNEIIKD